MKLFSAMLLVFLPMASSCSDAGFAVGGRAIEPNLPHEDPASYPDNPISVEPPRVEACPFKSTNACPDVWAPPAGDAGTEAGQDASLVDEPDSDASDDDPSGFGRRDRK
jgi:hypothetical protein